jgi:hypothetical protein
MRYNPFEKDISKLEANDLEKLKSEKVAEGWYVEYKSDFPPKNKKVGHSIASFANSEGGWYIIGVKDEDETNIAKEIVGIDLEGKMPKEKLASIIKDYIEPIPYFESILVKISEKKGVLIVKVIKGEESPYLTRDGKVYQRIGEVSDPVAITDVHTMRKLYERSENTKLKIEKFSQNPFKISKFQAEQNRCFLEAYFYISSPKFNFNNFHSDEFFDDMKENFSTNVQIFNDRIKAYLPFDNFYSSLNSYILRDLEDNDRSIDLVTTLELFNNGNLKMFLGVPTLPLKDDLTIIDLYKYNTNYKKFLDILSRNEKTSLRIIDGHSLLTAFYIIFNQYKRILIKNGFKENIGVRFKISKCWRTLMFFNDEKYLDLLNRYGVPVCLKSEIEVPEFSGGNLLTVDFEEENEALNLIIKIYEALGLPPHFMEKTIEGLSNFIAFHPNNSK